jgi:outer membrane protein insertion porin family
MQGFRLNRAPAVGCEYALLLVASLLPLQVSLGQPATSAQTASPLIAGVRIIGNETTEERFVQSQLRTKKDREFDPEIVQADVARLAATGRFRDIRTYTQNTPAGIVVTFQVFERPTIRYIRFHGNRGIRDKVLAKQDGLDVGDPLNRYAVDEARRKIEEFYHSKGYSKCQVFVREGAKPEDRGAVFEINEGFLQRIWKVEFVGNTIASDGRLETQIKSKPGVFWYLFRGKVNPKQIDEDIDRLTAYYRNLGYFNARIGRELQFGKSGKWLTITFVIDEGPRYVLRNITIAGNRRFSTESLLERMELKSGDYFDHGKMNLDVNTLVDIYGGQGHIFVDVQPDPRFLEEPGQLDLVYNIEEGGVWRAGRINVHIAGEHPHTRESVVRNRMSVRPGDVIDMREVRASERRLTASQLFLNDPTTGKKPRVDIRPPELQESWGPVAGRGSSGTTSYRGQSPDDYP